MNINEIKKNIKQFFRGEETEEGRKLIDKWYHYFDSDSPELTGFSDEKKEQLRKELLVKIQASVNCSLRSSHRYEKNYRSNNWPLKIAAGFIILLMILLPVWYYEDTLIPPKSSPKPIASRTVSNPAGQASKITLPDGSNVWLSAASTLTFPQKFSGKIRKVALKGEAFFKIAHNADQPFIVDCRNIQTRVLGTSFNVRVFKDERDIQVTVASGRVAIQQKADSAGTQEIQSAPIAILDPDQQLAFNRQTQTSVKRSVNSRLYTSWKDGRLIFKNSSFEEIARRLERWYGVRIHFLDASLKQIRFKVNFANSSLTHALRMLQVIENFEFKMNGNQVWIKPAASEKE